MYEGSGVKPAARKPAKIEPGTVKRKIKKGGPTVRRYSALANLSFDELRRKPVVKLRQIARKVDGLEIHGRQISIANKRALLTALRKVM